MRFISTRLGAGHRYEGGSVWIGVMLAGLSFLLPAAPARAQLDATLQAFDEGNALYAAGQYQAALASYERAVHAGYVSGPLFYNMGNAHYRLDALGQAVRYYEKARPFLPDKPELLHNLEIVRARTPDQFSLLPPPFWAPWWDALRTHVGAGLLFGVGLLCYLVALGLFAYQIWYTVRLPWQRRLQSLALLGGIVLLSLGFAASLDPLLRRRAVVVEAEVPLRTAPTPEAPSDLQLHEGLVLDVLKTNPSWTEVRLPNGATGWLDAEALAEI